MAKEIIRPIGKRIEWENYFSTSAAKAKGTSALFVKEDLALEAVLAAARELGTVLGHSREEFWNRTLPEAILSLLNSFETETVRAAVEVWREQNR